MAGIFLNTVNFFPSDISFEYRKIGVTLPAASGRRRFVHRLSGATPIFKAQWELSWDRATEAIRGQIAVVRLLTTTFPYVDQHGISWTVQTEEEGYTSSAGKGVLIAGNGTLYYNITLKLWEA